jgi:phosphate transport system permease protein
MNKSKLERFFKGFFQVAGASVLLILIGIFAMLVYNGFFAFREISLSQFFLSAQWSPSAFGEATYGILSMVVSSGLVTIGALALATPIGIGAAAYLSEFAPPQVERIAKPAIEMLAAIPSVTIGFLGIVVVGPWLARVFGLSNGLNALNGAVLMAVMALPTIISIAEDAIYAVPEKYKEASYALGANRWETLLRVTLPAAASGMIAAVMLAMGRVIGETMAVLMATGNATAMPTGFFSAVRPLTATIAIEMGEVPYHTTHYYSLFALGGILFLITLGINLAADRMIRRIKRFA